MKKNELLIINKSAGKVIRLLRRRKQITGSELGELIGISQQQISRYERGTNRLTLDFLIQVLFVLNISVDDFFYQLDIQCGFADENDMLYVYSKKDKIFINDERM